MDKDRDNIIDDMFEYYDNNDMDDTMVVKPQEEILGETRIVNTASCDIDNNEFYGTDETTQIEIPVSRRTPAEEVLGNMDLEGRIIEHAPQTYTRRVTPSFHENINEPPSRAKRTEYRAPASRPASLWYKLKPLWATLAFCIVLVGAFKFYMTDTGIIGTYKRNFSYNMSLILRTFGVETKTFDGEIDEIEEYEEFIGSTSSISDFFSATGLSITAYADDGDGRPTYNENFKKIATLPFQGAGDAKFCEYDNGVVCAKSNYVCYIAKNGEIKWEYTTPVSQPILAAAGDYVAVAGEDSTQLILYKKGKLQYSTEAKNSIKSCSVSENGDVTLVTDKTAYKGAVCVYNSKGEEVFSWISGVNYITSATIAKNRCVSVSLVSAEDDITSYVMVFDIHSTDPVGGSEFSNTLIYYTSAYKNLTLAYGDNSVSGIKDNGETKYNVLFDSMAITHTAEDVKGHRMVSYTDNHLPYLNIYTPAGKLRYSIAIEVSPDYIDLYKSTVLYNNGRDIICGKANDSRKTKYSAPMTVKNLVMLSKNTYMVAYENSLEFIKI